MVVAPLVGFDVPGYRLGYGGGYYDRTLAAMPDRRRAIGVGFEISRMETIHPQPHDIPMSLIVTEQRVIRHRGRHAGSPARPIGNEAMNDDMSTAQLDHLGRAVLETRPTPSSMPTARA